MKSKKAVVSKLVSLIIFVIVMILLYYLMLNQFDFPAAVQDMVGLFGQNK